MAERLTDLRVQNATAPEGKRVILWDSVASGLGLRVGGRKKTWIAFYRLGGRRVMQTLGEYGEPPAGVSLVEARKACRAALAKLEDYEDPRRHVAEVVPEQARESVASVVADYLRLHVDVRLKAKSAREYRALLRRLTADWGGKPVTLVTRRDVLDLTEGLVADGKLASAVSLHRVLSGFFNWSVSRGVLTVSPMHGLKPPARVADRDRVLSDDELRVVWAAAERLAAPWGPYVRFLLLSGQRAGEVARMRRQDLDRDLWSIPDTKRKTPHLLRLPPLALRLLAGLPSFEGAFLFTTSEGEAPISPNSHLKAEPAPGRVRAKSPERARGHRPGLLDQAIQKLVAEDPARWRQPGPWRLHDLRRTCASKLAELRTPPHVIEALLNHKSGTIKGVARVYNRYQYQDEVGQALATWARHLQRLVGKRKRARAAKASPGRGG